MNASSLQVAELHYSNTDAFDLIIAAKRAEFLLQSGIKIVEPEVPGTSQLLLIAHEKCTIPYPDEGKEVAIQTAVIERMGAINIADYEPELQQTRRCADAEARLQSTRKVLIVSELMASQGHPPIRLALFHGVLQSLIEITKPTAIVFRHSQEVVDPEAYLAGAKEFPLSRPGGMNVRLFRVDNGEEGDCVMDTRGLTEIGLHDFQMHFRNLDPAAVAQLLFNIAAHIVEHGPVIESGHAIEGLEPGSQWVCQFEPALVEPIRDVLDINPGPPFAAGGR
jgi:hypothetical protein